MCRTPAPFNPVKFLRFAITSEQRVAMLKATTQYYRFQNREPFDGYVPLVHVFPNPVLPAVPRRILTRPTLIEVVPVTTREPTPPILPPPPVDPLEEVTQLTVQLPIAPVAIPPVLVATLPEMQIVIPNNVARIDPIHATPQQVTTPVEPPRPLGVVLAATTPGPDVVAVTTPVVERPHLFTISTTVLHTVDNYAWHFVKRNTAIVCFLLCVCGLLYVAYLGLFAFDLVKIITTALCALLPLYLALKIGITLRVLDKHTGLPIALVPSRSVGDVLNPGREAPGPNYSGERLVSYYPQVYKKVYNKRAASSISDGLHRFILNDCITLADDKDFDMVVMEHTALAVYQTVYASREYERGFVVSSTGLAVNGMRY